MTTQRGLLIAALAAMLFAGIAIGRTYTRDVIEVEQAAIELRIGEIERGRGKRLTDAERDAAASAYIDEHVLARVARNRGFDDDDRIRGILYQRMLQLLASAAPDPSDAELQEYFARNRARYAAAEAMTAEHWSVTDGQRKRQAVLARVSATELALAFGPRIAQDAAAARIGENVPLDRGNGAPEWLVIVERFSPGVAPPFESVRHQVRFDWRAEHDDALLKQRVAEFRNQYVVRIRKSVAEPSTAR